MLEAKVNKGRVQLKCCGEMAEIAADIMMIVTGIYSQIEGEEEKEAFRFGMRMIMMDSKSWEDTMERRGVCIVIPHRREERND